MTDRRSFLRSAVYTAALANLPTLAFSRSAPAKGDPFGQVGYIKSHMFRAARLVVDTGLHRKRWTREQGVEYMVQSLGELPSAITTEVERYCCWLGQATSYKIDAVAEGFAKTPERSWAPASTFVSFTM